MNWELPITSIPGVEEVLKISKIVHVREVTDDLLNKSTPTAVEGNAIMFKTQDFSTFGVFIKTSNGAKSGHTSAS